MRHKHAALPLPGMKGNAGFTLVEMIIVIVITSIIAAIVAVFLYSPVRGYFDSARRAELTDIADTALRRVSRDLHLALPNSVRVSGAAVEFLQTRTGGRYRADPATSGASVGCGSLADDTLDFTTSDTCFEVLGGLNPAAVVGDLVVVYNLGIDDATAYAGDNSSAVTGIVGNKISINTKQFPFESPGNRFQVVSGPVSYVCSGVGTNANGDGTGELRRYSGYAVSLAQSVPPGGPSALLASRVSACSFVYEPGVTERSGLVSLQLQISEAGETVSLYHEVHVSNAP